MRPTPLLTPAFLCLFAPALAGEAASTPRPSPSPTAAAPEGQDPELASLMAIIQEETAVATKERLNADFVPGIVTVLHGEELEALGFETVGEALSMVPGVQTVRDTSGIHSLIVRGVDFPFNTGNVKVLVDSMSLSREAAGVNNIVLQMPIGAVDRIEVIRGPGSVVYGDFAFMGLVNIITRGEGSRVFARRGPDEALSAGGQLAWRDAADRTQVRLGLAGWTSDEAILPVPRVGDEQRGFGSLEVRHGGARLAAEALTRHLGPAAGSAVFAPAEQRHRGVDGGYGRDFSKSVHGDFRASYRDHRFVGNNQTFEGSVAELAGDLRGQLGPRHAWLAGVSYALGAIDEATRRLPAPPPPPPGVTPAPLPPDILLRDEQRNVFSVTLQDRFDVSKAVALTVGARFDDYSDVGRRVTPRFALVWRLTDRHILKLQHAEGFRAPTFFELYASNRRQPDLGFEINATTELNYVLRRPRTATRVTLFRTRLRDMIYVAGPTRFDNTHHAAAHGAEVELEQQLGRRIKLLANASWVDEEDDRNAQRISRPSWPTAEWLSNLALLFRPTSRTVLSTRWNHVGQRELSSAGAYDAWDLSATQTDLFLRGLQLRAGVKNLLDDERAYVFGRPEAPQVVTYDARRTFWVQLAFSR